MNSGGVPVKGTVSGARGKIVASAFGSDDIIFECCQTNRAHSDGTPPLVCTSRHQPDVTKSFRKQPGNVVDAHHITRCMRYSALCVINTTKLIINICEVHFSNVWSSTLFKPTWIRLYGENDWVLSWLLINPHHVST